MPRDSIARIAIGLCLGALFAGIFLRTDDAKSAVRPAAQPEKSTLQADRKPPPPPQQNRNNSAGSEKRVQSRKPTESEVQKLRQQLKEAQVALMKLAGEIKNEGLEICFKKALELTQSLHPQLQFPAMQIFIEESLLYSGVDEYNKIIFSKDKNFRKASSNMINIIGGRTAWGGLLEKLGMAAAHSGKSATLMRACEAAFTGGDPETQEDAAALASWGMGYRSAADIKAYVDEYPVPYQRAIRAHVIKFWDESGRSRQTTLAELERMWP